MPQAPAFLASSTAAATPSAASASNKTGLPLVTGLLAAYGAVSTALARKQARALRAAKNNSNHPDEPGPPPPSSATTSSVSVRNERSLPTKPKTLPPPPRSGKGGGPRQQNDIDRGDPNDATATDPSLRRFLCTVAYDGTQLQGFQSQPTGNTVQDALEHALVKFVGTRIVVHPAGRTDAGVSAKKQVFHIDVPECTQRGIVINSKLLLSTFRTQVPGTIVVESVHRVVKQLFHSRRSCIKKKYAYTLFRGFADPFRRPYVWELGSKRVLDVDAMRQAAKCLIGRHDFTSLSIINEGDDRNPVKTMESVSICEENVGSASGAVVITTICDRYMYKMMRIISGTLTQVGLGKLSVKEFEDYFKAAKRMTSVAVTAPGNGLMLHEVFYDPIDTAPIHDTAEEPNCITESTPCASDWISRSGVPRERYLHFYAVSEQSRGAAENWIPRPSDVLIATHSKSGTTVLQNMLEALRSGGDIGFEEITEVQPWLDFCLDVDIDPSSEQKYWPRLFKSHQAPGSLNRGCRVASVVRSPSEILRSYYAFYVAKNHPFVKGKTLDEWAVSWVETGSSVGPVWRFYRQLWACRNAFAAEIQCIADNSYVDETDRQLAMLAAYNCSPFVLLEYGGLCTEMDSHAHRLAHWLIGSHTCASTARNIASMENVQRAVRLCSREKMASMVSKFDDHWLYERQIERSCSVPMQPAAKVLPSQKSPARAPVSTQTRLLLEQCWTEKVLPQTGLASWSEMAGALHADHQNWLECWSHAQSAGLRY